MYVTYRFVTRFQITNRVSESAKIFLAFLRTDVTLTTFSKPEKVFWRPFSSYYYFAREQRTIDSVNKFSFVVVRAVVRRLHGREFSNNRYDRAVVEKGIRRILRTQKRSVVETPNRQRFGCRGDTDEKNSCCSTGRFTKTFVRSWYSIYASTRGE